MEIKSISKNLFGVKKKNCESNQTNPFGVSFNGRMISKDIVSSDVFVRPAKAKITEKVAGKTKGYVSAIVGSIGDVSSVIKTRFNSMVSYGRRIKSNVENTWSQIRDFRPMDGLINAKNLLESKLTFSSDYRVGSLLKNKNMTDIESKFRDVLAEREALNSERIVAA